jgi:AhpD family alkylhydroperoxidase
VARAGALSQTTGLRRLVGMMQRLNLQQVAPDALKAMYGLETYIQRNVDHGLLHLVKLRASVLNGCAYCVDMHSTDALKGGESARRLFAVSAWRESPFFTDVERAAFALTDAVTEMGPDGIPDDVWEAAKIIGTEKQLVDLLMAIVTINAWNRIAVTLHNQPPPEPAR